ncbi:MAG: serine hydrolase domain-containing protein, partial [Bacteroidales bacterium]
MKTTLNFNFLAVFLTVITLIFSCTPKSKEQVANKKILEIMEQTQAVGLAVAVVKDCSIIFSNSYGLKEIESNTPLAQDHLFRIASISKSFTTTALMTLVEQDKVALDTDV